MSTLHNAEYQEALLLASYAIKTALVQTGVFFADACLSVYRPGKPFKHSLGELVRLDAEGFRLFHEVLHIRHVKGWNDAVLYDIEQQVLALKEVGA